MLELLSSQPSSYQYIDQHLSYHQPQTQQVSQQRHLMMSSPSDEQSLASISATQLSRLSLKCVNSNQPMRVASDEGNFGLLADVAIAAAEEQSRLEQQQQQQNQQLAAQPIDLSKK